MHWVFKIMFHVFNSSFLEGGSIHRCFSWLNPDFLMVQWHLLLNHVKIMCL